MNIGETCEVVLLDRAGCELFRRDFDLMKEARRFFKETKGDQGFWERHAECKDFPLDIRTIQLVKNGEVVEDSIPRFKGSPEHELAKRRAILSCVESTRLLPDCADEIDAEDLRADGFLDIDEGEWFLTSLGEMEIEGPDILVAAVVGGILSTSEDGGVRP